MEESVRKSSEPFELDQAKYGQIKPCLGEVEGFNLTPNNLKDVFGIQQDYFGKLPKTIIIPSLKGRFYTEQWYHVTGYLYEFEPEEWVPVVSHKKTIPASIFKTTYISKEEKISQTEFNAGTSAEISIEAGGSYFGVTASVKSNSEIDFKYKQSSTTTETLETKGVSGNEPIYQLCVYPILKGKAVRRQYIDYTINDYSNELKWTEKSHEKGYWEVRQVKDGRLDDVRKLQLHPVPMDGEGLSKKAYMLPLPWFKGNALNFTTLMSRQSWENWYIYDLHQWETCNKPMSIAAPNNSVAFQPMATWTTLPPLKS